MLVLLLFLSTIISFVPVQVFYSSKVFYSSYSTLAFATMDDFHKKGGNNDGKWASVPVFGDWDAAQGVPDYSMDFSKIRELKMKNKHDLSGLSIGNETELLVPNSDPPKNPSPLRPTRPPPGPAVVLADVDGDRPIVRKRIWDYLPRCLKA